MDDYDNHNGDDDHDDDEDDYDDNNDDSNDGANNNDDYGDDLTRVHSDSELEIVIRTMSDAERLEFFEKMKRHRCDLSCMLNPVPLR